jgi:predicted transcriptional regulator
MSQKTVGDLMHKGVIACRPDTAMDEVVRIVNDTSVHAIVVMRDDQLPLGMVTHLDIVRLFGQDLPNYTADDVMQDGVIMISSGEPASRAAEMMLEHQVDRLLVTEMEADKQVLVGVISTTDLVKDMRGARWIWHAR